MREKWNKGHYLDRNGLIWEGDIGDFDERSDVIVPAIVEYIKGMAHPKGKFIPYHPFSYSWKHMIEEMAQRYITNGEFILSAKLAGIPYKADRIGSPNALFAFEPKFVRASLKVTGSKWRYQHLNRIDVSDEVKARHEKLVRTLSVLDR